VVIIGSTIVGEVTLSFSHLSTNNGVKSDEESRFDPAIPVKKGGELGSFRVGSMVVMLMEGRWTPRTLVEGSPVRVGEPLFSPAAIKP